MHVAKSFHLTEDGHCNMDAICGCDRFTSRSLFSFFSFTNSVRSASDIPLSHKPVNESRNKKKKNILGYGVFVQVQQRHAPRSEVLFQTGKMIENGHQVQTVITSINNRHHFRFGAAKKHEELITRNLDGKIKHGHVNHSIPHDTDIPIAL